LPTLLDLPQGETAIVLKVRGRGAFRRRITEMGFIRGREVTVIKSAPLQDPVEYKLMGYYISLRKSEASLIEVASLEEYTRIKVAQDLMASFDSNLQEELMKSSSGDKGNLIEVALVGNPNSGKTTLFNHASGSHERVGNFSGVTVDSKTARLRQDGYTFKITDLPGTYSISAWSPEELFVRKHILEEVPDVVVNVVDASNLERNLYLTSQLIDMDIRVVLALNMYDEFEAEGHRLQIRELALLLGIPIVTTVSNRGQGIRELFSKVAEVYEDHEPLTRHVHINYGNDLERSIAKIQEIVRTDRALTDRISSRFFSIKLLEGDPEIREQLQNSPSATRIGEVAGKEIQRLESIYDEEPATLITDARYGFITGALRETMKPAAKDLEKKPFSEQIDTLLTHKYLGFPFFILFLWIMFQSTFVLGSYPQDWIDAGVSLFGETVRSMLHDGPFKDLLVDGIISGVGSVIVFLPNILILFFFISLMEDTGYMARAAFIMDRLMHRMGLHGQSFIPLIMGFGCNVPAIMVTRTLKNRNDRLLTMLINPLMTCSARLPVYILITGAIFPKHAGTVIFGMYLTGIVLAILMSLLFKHTLFRASETPFVMELPPYRMPTSKAIVRHMWERAQQYLRKMGGVILIAVILIWALGYFPGGKDVAPDQRLENSYISKIGKFIEPAIAPLGFDWKMGVSLITGAAAKEVVVSTMGVLYCNMNATSGKEENLPEILRQERYQSGPREGTLIFTPLAGISYLIFILIYMPCVAVIATVKRESGSWKWALFLIFYTTALAWLLSFSIYQIGSLL